MPTNSSQFIATSLDAKFDLNKKKFYAGNWCFSSREEEKKILDNKDIYTAPNPWADIDLLEKDYIYMQNLLDTYTLKLSNFLNKYHKTNYSERYWNILIGTWLIYYIPSQIV